MTSCQTVGDSSSARPEASWQMSSAEPGLVMQGLGHQNLRRCKPEWDAAYLFQLAASLAKQRSNVLPFGCICGQRLLAVVHYLQGTRLPFQCKGMSQEQSSVLSDFQGVQIRDTPHTTAPIMALPGCESARILMNPVARRCMQSITSQTAFRPKMWPTKKCSDQNVQSQDHTSHSHICPPGLHVIKQHRWARTTGK